LWLKNGEKTLKSSKFADFPENTPVFFKEFCFTKARFSGNILNRQEFPVHKKPQDLNGGLDLALFSNQKQALSAKNTIIYS